VCASIFGKKPGLHRLCMAPCDRHSKERQRGTREGVGNPRGRSTPDRALSPPPSCSGPLVVYRPCLWSFTLIGDHLIWVWALFLHMARPWFGLVVGLLLLGSFFFSQYCVILCFFAHFECVFHVFHECPPANGQTPKLVEIVSSKALFLSLVPVC
jgi:hypothetical protein